MERRSWVVWRVCLAAALGGFLGGVAVAAEPPKEGEKEGKADSLSCRVNGGVMGFEWEITVFPGGEFEFRRSREGLAATGKLTGAKKDEFDGCVKAVDWESVEPSYKGPISGDLSFRLAYVSGGKTYLTSADGFSDAPRALLKLGAFLFNSFNHLYRGTTAEVTRTEPPKEGDLRVVLTWSRPCDLDLHVTEPDGSKAWFQSKQTRSGGMIDMDDTKGTGPESYSLSKVVLPGEYTVGVCFFNDPAPGAPVTATVKVYRDFGRPNQQLLGTCEATMEKADRNRVQPVVTIVLPEFRVVPK